MDPTRLPIPGSYVKGGSYPLKVEFSNVLSLPARAKVQSGGVQVGVLDRVQLVGTTAVAYIDVSSDVKLPQNTKASLRQATILGDVSIVLSAPDKPSSALLRGGDTIPLRNTTPSDSVEDSLRSLSSIVSGGQLTALQKTMLDVNEAFPQDPETVARLQQKLTGALRDLASHQATIDQLLTNLGHFGDEVNANKDSLRTVISEGPAKLAAVAQPLDDVIHIAISLGHILQNAAGVIDTNAPGAVQAISSIIPLLKAFAASDWSNVAGLVDKVVDLIRDELVGYFQQQGKPNYTVVGARVMDGQSSLDPSARANQLITTMRTIGLLAP